MAQQKLTRDLPHAAVILGGDLQTAPSAKHPSHNQALDLFCTSTGLRPLGDPCTPTFTPTSTPSDHWLLRLPHKYTTQSMTKHTQPKKTPHTATTEPSLPTYHKLVTHLHYQNTTRPPYLPPGTTLHSPYPFRIL